MMRAVSLIALLSLLIATKAELNVYMPPCALKAFGQTTTIEYNMANFGHIPYDATLTGELTLPKDSDIRMCKNDPNEMMKMDDIPSFMLIERGHCKFTKKIIEAQNLNHKLVIIYDNETSTTPKIVMGNDGHGHLVDIPSIFISRTDGQKLINASQECKGSVILLIKFETFKKQEADTKFWLDINHRESFIMMRNFYSIYFPYVKDLMKVSVSFNVKEKCTSCSESDCVQDKFLCYPADTTNPLPASGKEILEEYLRSYFILEEFRYSQPDLWWKYMIQFDERICIEKKDVKACSEEIMYALQISAATIQALIKQQRANFGSRNTSENVLYNFVVSARSSDILYYPQATINDHNFYGMFKAQQIFDMVCESLEDPPHECVSFITPQQQKQVYENQLWWVIMVVIFTMTGSFVVVLVFYTKVIRKEVNMQLSVEVNKMVENYVALSEQKSQTAQRSEGAI